MRSKILNHFLSKPQSIDERIEKGKALRAKLPRAKLGEFKPNSKRSNPVAILEKQGKTRLQALVPIRYSRMLSSPFAFLRGAAAIMAEDLSTGPVSGISIQSCGDAHMANFGVFASAERNLIFGINDFDETLTGPWEWDLKRLVASMVIGGRSLGASEDVCREAVLEASAQYRKRMKQYAQMGYLQLRYDSINEKNILDSLNDSARAGAEKIMKKARERTHMQVLGKLTDLVDEKYRLRENAPFLVRETKTETGLPIEEAVGLFFESYTSNLSEDRKYLLQKYRVVDVARKVVGVGSVGTRCWVILLMGNHQDDPLFLQLKEANASVLEPFLKKTNYKNHGQRVVEGQRLIQAAPDIFLSWGDINGFQFYVRQLRDMKGGIEFDSEKINVNNLPQYGKLCAWSLAQAHAKSGDAALIAGYVGNSDELDEAMYAFANAYAKQNDKDYAALKAAAKSGKIKVAGKEA
ncbi:MAG: DUF2252 domain-containing protein [Bacteroidia bacterium]|jgi:uncharacterized protein (DUF2252 family)|nr:DUF2252 domain-containing protein [Bacteroidia bacterium]